MASLPETRQTTFFPFWRRKRSEVRQGRKHIDGFPLQTRLYIYIHICIYIEREGEPISHTEGCLLTNHFLQFLVCQVLSQLRGHPFQVPEGNRARAIVVKEGKNLECEKIDQDT
jgi:hypothetical protein